jgi:antitoxin component HigA of HigAB toxin-antitoxin module
LDPEELDERDHVTPEEDHLAKLLALLIQDFEDRQYHKIKATPLEILHLLMDSNNLKQPDMIPIFGSKGITSEVFNGKRPFSKTYIHRRSASRGCWVGSMCCRRQAARRRKYRSATPRAGYSSLSCE